MDQHFNQAYSLLDSDPNESEKNNHGSADVQSLLYHRMPLSKLPQKQAIGFIDQLFHPEERFALGFYRYWKEILKMPEEEAWQATLDELEEYRSRLIQNLADPRYHTLGFNQQGQYTPVGLYGFRALEDHNAGQKLLMTFEEKQMTEQYSGKLSIAHSFSALNGYRNRILMRYAFLCIALEAVEQEFKHIFFFMSDYRLGAIYKRLGMDFPPDLTFPDSKHLVGCYSIEKHMQDIRDTAKMFGQPMPVVSDIS